MKQKFYCEDCYCKSETPLTQCENCRRQMKIKIGEIYKVKYEFRNKCFWFKNTPKSTYIKITDKKICTFRILKESNLEKLQDTQNTNEILDFDEKDFVEKIELSFTYKILDINKKEIESCRFCFKPEHLEPIEKPFDNLKIGDIVENNDGFRREILGFVIQNDINERLYMLSTSASKSTELIDSASAKQLEKLGYKVEHK